MSLRFAPRAETDLKEIFDFVASEDIAAAHRVREAILEKARLIAKQPYVGIQNAVLPRIRSALVPRHQYRIHYEVRGPNILIVHIRHTARRPWVPWNQ